MKLSYKIIIGFGVLLLLLLLLMGIYRMFAQQVTENIQNFIEIEDRRTNSAHMQQQVSNMQSSLRGYLLTNDDTFVKTHYYSLANFNSDYDKLFTKFKEKDTVQLEYLDAIGDRVSYWQYVIARPLLQYKSQGQDDPVASAVYDSLYRYYVVQRREKAALDTVRQLFEELDASLFRIHDDLELQTEGSLRKLRNLVTVMALTMVIVGAALGFWLTRHISRRINGMISLAEDISGGRYNIRINDSGNDEMSRLADALNRMSANLQDTFSNLAESNKQLLEVNRELEQFAYVASHDLKEPVRMVSNYTQLLATRYNENLPDEAKEYIEYAVEGSHRIRHLILDLLEYVKISKWELKLQPVNTQELVEQICEGFSKALEETGGKVEIRNLPIISADLYLLRTLFYQLIDNSIKFADPERKLVVEIEAKNEFNRYIFSIKDNGIGIDQQFIEKAFVIFQRLHIRGSYSGNGLGLTLSKKIVELHNGHIWVDSQLGKGTTITFSLPKAG